MISRGVKVYCPNNFDNPDICKNISYDQLVKECYEWAKKNEWLSKGDSVIMIRGIQKEKPEDSNLIKVVTIK